MTTDRDIERILDLWLTDGPTQVSDRAFDEAVDRLRRQRQRPAWRVTWRLPRMSTPFRIAVLGAALLAALVGGAVLFGGGAGPSPEPQPSASPSATASSDSTPLEIATALIDAGNADDSVAFAALFAPGASISAFGTHLPDAAGLLDTWDCTASVDSSSPGRPEGKSVVLTTRMADCPDAGEIVTIVVSVTDGRISSLVLSSTMCRSTDSTCIGDLVPGTHATGRILTPFRYAVPAGWAKPLDEPGAVNLEPTIDARLAGASPGLIGIWPDWAIATQTSCTSDHEPGLGHTVDDLVAFLVGHPGLVSSDPQPVSLGGLDGMVLDVRKEPGWTGPCPGRVSLFTHRSTIDDVGFWDIGEYDRLRLYFLNAADGHVVNVDIQTSQAEEFEPFLEIATPIVESFVFDPAP